MLNSHGQDTPRRSSRSRKRWDDRQPPPRSPFPCSSLASLPGRSIQVICQVRDTATIHVHVVSLPPGHFARAHVSLPTLTWPDLLGPVKWILTDSDSTADAAGQSPSGEPSCHCWLTLPGQLGRRQSACPSSHPRDPPRARRDGTPPGRVGDDVHLRLALPPIANTAMRTGASNSRFICPA